MGAFCFDRAVTHFGSYVENAIEVAKSKVKKERQKVAAAKRELNRYLYAGSTDVKGRYADPASARRG